MRGATVDFDGNYRELGEITPDEHAALRRGVALAAPEVWDSTTRQKDTRAHEFTSAIILCFGPDDDPDAAAFTEHWPAWRPLLEPVLDRVTTRHFGADGRLLRLMVVRLFPGYSVAPHTDDLPVLHVSHRVHIPLRTSGAVAFVVGNQVVPMREGHVVEINNQREHYVTNAGKDDRVHVIFDYATSDDLARFAG
jgi:Aspartyl/Asparaginyl beta-hydroxylase